MLLDGAAVAEDVDKDAEAEVDAADETGAMLVEELGE